MKKIIILSVASLISMGAQASPPPIHWAGFYAGLNGGYGWGKEKLKNTDFYNGGVLAVTMTGSELVTDPNPNFSSGFGGGQVGYNYVFNDSGLLGLEANLDIGSFGADYTSTAVASFTAKSSMDWIGSVKARLGFLASDALFFATGGVAFANEKFKLNDNYSGPPITLVTEDSQSRTGWTVGAGFEYPIYDHFTVKLEYQYISFGNKQFTVHEANPPGWDTINTNSSNSINMGRLGFNYYFC